MKYYPPMHTTVVEDAPPNATCLTVADMSVFRPGDGIVIFSPQGERLNEAIVAGRLRNVIKMMPFCAQHTRGYRVGDILVRVMVHKSVRPR